MPTPQQLIYLSTELTDSVKSINAIVAKQELPYDEETRELSTSAARLAVLANAIGQAGLSALAHEIREAMGELNSQVKSAKERSRKSMT